MTDCIELPEDCTGVYVRKGDYRGTCGGFPDGRTPYRNEIHHILCEHAILKIKPESDEDGLKRDYIMDCLCVAEYDLNDKDNLMGLPLKEAYIRSGGTKPENLPCHDVDHNKTPGNYTDEVNVWLHDNIWNVLIDRRKKHDTTAEDIVSQLEQCMTTFKKRLEKRGRRGVKPGGTLKSWQGRFDKANARTWYLPFSMMRKPNKRSPGGRWNKPIFEIIR